MNEPSTSPIAPGDARAVELGLVASLAVIVSWLVATSRSWPLVHDAPIMHYIAWRILEGDVPYRDLFDMNFPGLYLVHVAVVAMLGTSDAAWRVVDLGATGAAATLVFALAAPWGRVPATGGALFFVAYHLAGGAWSAGQRDLLLCPALLGGAIGVAQWAERGGLRPLWLGGAALGIGVTIKPHAFLYVALLAGFMVVHARRADRAAALPAAVLVGAAAIAPAAVVAWVISLGAFGAWRDVVLGYLVPLYSQLVRSADWVWLRWKMWIAVAIALLLTLSRLVAVRGLTARHHVALLGLAYGLAHFVGQRKGWEYHLYPAAAFGALLLFGQVRPTLLTSPRLIGPALTAAVAAAIWIVAFDGERAAASARLEDGWVVQKERLVTALAADLAALTRPGEVVQVLDTTEGAVHALLRRRLVQPTRFLYDFHFFHDIGTPTIERLRAEFLHALATRPPALIVVTQRDWLGAGYERADRFDALAADVGPAPSENAGTAFPALHDLLARAYRLERQGDGYRIYAKRHDP
jgi:hypothetical protein